MNLIKRIKCYLAKREEFFLKKDQTLSSDLKLKSKYNISYIKKILLRIIIKLLVILIFIIVIYGIYLDHNIHIYIEKKEWQLPGLMYNRMINLKPQMIFKKKYIIQLLKNNKYSNLYRDSYHRWFDITIDSREVFINQLNFSDRNELPVGIKLFFDQNFLKNIENIKKKSNFKFFLFNLKLFTIFPSLNINQNLFIQLKSFPKILIDTLLLIEDRNFYKHNGISFYAICRAILANFNANHIVQGGSTLTQQLVRNLFLSNKRSYWRKINEVYMALLMESRFDKDQILELYMNKVYLGQYKNREIHGFPLASLYYFGCPISKLRFDQQALLVGMLKSSSIYNPCKHPKLALKRRNLILYKLLQQHIITKKTYNFSIHLPLDVKLDNKYKNFVTTFYSRLNKNY